MKASALLGEPSREWEVSKCWHGKHVYAFYVKTVGVEEQVNQEVVDVFSSVLLRSVILR